MSIYIIKNAKTKEEIFEFTNKREAKKELNRMNKGEQDVCSPEGISKPYILEEIDYKYIVCDTTTDDILQASFMRIKEAREHARYLLKESIKEHHRTYGKHGIREYVVGIRCMRTKEEDYNCTTSEHIAYRELEIYNKED